MFFALVTIVFAFCAGGAATLFAMYLFVVVLLDTKTRGNWAAARTTSCPAYAAVLKEKSKPVAPITRAGEELHREYDLLVVLCVRIMRSRLHGRDHRS
jgi:hypothetical protein